MFAESGMNPLIYHLLPETNQIGSNGGIDYDNQYHYRNAVTDPVLDHVHDINLSGTVSIETQVHTHDVTIPL